MLSSNITDIIHEFILRVSPLIHEYGAWGVFLVSFIEEIIVPIPSSFILLAAGFFLLPVTASFGEVALQTMWLVVLPGALGLTLGSLVVYSVAYLGGEPAIRSWGKWFGVSWADVEKMQAKFTKSHWDEVALFGLRTIPIVPHVILSMACGLVRYPIRAFTLTTLFGTMVRAFTMSILGWYLGEAYVSYSENITAIGDWFLWVLGGLVVLWIVWHLYRRYRPKTQ
jgi:membrane protein DedA with SNARE-associated domain